MADKTIVFSDQEQAQIQEIIIDQDKDEALKFVIALMDRIKGGSWPRLRPQGRLTGTCPLPEFISWGSHDRQGSSGPDFGYPSLQGRDFPSFLVF